MRGLIRPPLELRLRRPSDDAFIGELARAAFAEYDPNSAATTLGMARRGTTWLACRGVQPVGFAVVRSAGRGAVELCAIAVAIEERGLGVGAELLAEVEHRLAVEGGGRLGIHTAQANLAAMDLFLKHGFQVERRLAGYYRGVFDACAMHKQVARVRP